MRLSTVAWFAAGCGLALAVVAVGSAVVTSVRDQAQPGQTDAKRLQAMTPAPQASDAQAVVAPQAAPEGSWSNVPIQRPRHLREAPPVAPPPPLPLVVPHPSWTPGEARLPSPEATLHWDPDNARMPDHAAVVMAARAYWNPDSAALPRPNPPQQRVAWDPDDARLPSS